MKQSTMKRWEDFFDKTYPWLLGVSLVVSFGLVCLAVWIMVILVLEA